MVLQAFAASTSERLVQMPQGLLNVSMDIRRDAQEGDTPLADLLAAVAARQDRGAFATLFAHFAPRLKAYMRRLGLPEARAEDLVQEVMLIVWRRATLYDRAQASVSTWIFTIARNRRIDDLRRERRPEIDPDDPALVRDDTPAADLLVSRVQLGQRLRAAVEALPEEQAEVLRKNFFEDKPHGAIADELGLPLGTVKSRLRLGLAKLREAMRGLE